MLLYYAQPGEPLSLGHQGESMARQIVFDISQWENTFGTEESSVVLLHQRQEDLNPYPVILTRENGKIFWNVTAADTDQVCRYGKAELRYYIGETLVKSDVYRTRVLASLGPPAAQAPEAGDDWFRTLTNQLEQAEETVRSVELSVSRAAASASQAALSANASQTSANAAQTAANASQTSADAAQTAANASQTSADAAQTAANASQASADAAQTAANASQVSYETVQTTLSQQQQELSEQGEQLSVQQSELDSHADEIENLRDIILGLDAPFYRSTSANPITISDGYPAAVRELSVDIPATQSGSGDPSPSNIRPISGHSSVTVTRTDDNAANPQTVTVQLVNNHSDPLTVYGGTLNLTTGVLTVTHGIVDLGTMTWTKFDVRPNTIVATLGPNGDYPFGTIQGGIPGCMCSAYTPLSGLMASITAYDADTTKYFNTIVLSPHTLSTTQATIIIKDPALTPDNAQTQLSGVMFVYPKKTPVTYQLTPVEITTLAGNNILSSDAGNIHVTYRADPALTIQTLEAENTALTHVVLSLGANV